MDKMEKSIITKVYQSLSNEGIRGCASRTQKYLYKKMESYKRTEECYKDILFISGCNENLPHPRRYRVVHQREQLEAYHYATDEVYFMNLQLEQVRRYRAFVFFRCPYTELIGEFVYQAKKLNKKVIYDIDDLVIDTKYTDLIPYVQHMKKEDKKAYDENVMDMQKLLKSCDIAITSTDCLARELKSYVPTVYVNRNTASEKMQQLSEKAWKSVKRDQDKVKIGYFSGSITHNADFESILPALKNIMEKYSFVELHVMGELDIPDVLKSFESRIKKIPFGDWRILPEKIAEMDINLAPLEDNIFNEAKSENKWVEAALVKVVTIASNVGAFQQCIEDNKTGVLCNDIEEWERKLAKLIDEPDYRNQIAENAFRHCSEKCTTVGNGYKIAHIIKEVVQPNYGFILPGLEISGGIKVALKHAAILQNNGKDITLFLMDGKQKWYEFEESIFPVINLSSVQMEGNIGCAIATMWSTMEFVQSYPNISRRCYLVQNFETDFYKKGDELRIRANKTYMPYGNVEFFTISRWCQKWLKDKYGKESRYSPNGMDIKQFPCHKRLMNDKIRILIEGDCAVEYKNVDEAFQIAGKLDSERYEIWYMSYNAEPKKEYRVDRFFHKVPYEEVAKIYSECDILLKTSILESFSYPPLEMMATGGYVVVVPNGGNVEYLEHGENCLFYEQGNIEAGKETIECLVNDRDMQEKLFVNGRKTAEKRDWAEIEYDILKMYTCDK